MYAYKFTYKVNNHRYKNMGTCKHCKYMCVQNEPFTYVPMFVQKQRFYKDMHVLPIIICRCLY